MDEDFNKKTVLKILAIVIGFVFLLGAIGVAYTRTIGKDQANAEREVFKSTAAYTEQAASFLAKSYKEYSDADSADDKTAIQEYVIDRYPNLDTSSILNDSLKNFYESCMED